MERGDAAAQLKLQSLEEERLALVREMDRLRERETKFRQQSDVLSATEQHLKCETEERVGTGTGR